MGQDQYVCRWAALSLSNIAAVFLPDILLPRDASSSVKHELVAVSTTGTRERAFSWFREHNIPRFESIKLYHSWEEMLENGDFDAVYISTPHPLHFKMVRKALKCRRNVLVEKPATMRRQEYEQLSEMAIENGVVLMEAMWTRYLPAAKYFKEDLLPRIGKVKRVYAEFSFPIVSADLPHSSRFLDKRAGAGSLLDQGVYALTWADLALNGLDEDSSATEVVFANTISVPNVPDEVDDINTIILSKKDVCGKQGAVGIITTSMTIPGSSRLSFYHRLRAQKAAPAVRIEATKASVAIPFPPIRPEELHIQWYGDGEVDENGMERSEIVSKKVERGWGIWYQADVLAGRIRSNEASERRGEVIGREESLRVLGWMDQAQRLAGIVYNDLATE